MDDLSWVKYYRKSLNNPVFKKPLVWHYFNYCLLKANHKSQKIIWNGKEMIIDTGSFITGYKKSAQDTGLSVQSCRSASKILQNLKMIEKSTIKSTSRFTYLTICNYSDYQYDNNRVNNQTNKQATSKQQASTPQEDHEKEK